jgi:hypothetical protein
MRKAFGVTARVAPALAVFLITLTATATDEPSATDPATRPNAAPPSIKAFSHKPGFTEVALSLALRDARTGAHGRFLTANLKPAAP